jgi:hypothetical protein
MPPEGFSGSALGQTKHTKHSTLFPASRAWSASPENPAQIRRFKPGPAPRPRRS